MEISEGGISAIVTEPLNDGEEVELSFEVMPGIRIEARAVVRNHYHFRHGFEFLGISEEKRARIRALCASLKSYDGSWY